jgi:hypothetical protein
MDILFGNRRLSITSVKTRFFPLLASCFFVIHFFTNINSALCRSLRQTSMPINAFVETKSRARANSVIRQNNAEPVEGAPSWYKNFPPWWMNSLSMPEGYTHNLASVGALHPPSSPDVNQVERSKSWFLGMQNYAKMHSIVPPSNRAPASVQSFEKLKMLSPGEVGQAHDHGHDLFAMVSGVDSTPTNRPGLNSGVLSSHLANSGLAHMDGDGILANPLAVKEIKDLHQQATPSIVQNAAGGGMPLTHFARRV